MNTAFEVSLFWKFQLLTRSFQVEGDKQNSQTLIRYSTSKYCIGSIAMETAESYPSPPLPLKKNTKR